MLILEYTNNLILLEELSRKPKWRNPLGRKPGSIDLSTRRKIKLLQRDAAFRKQQKRMKMRNNMKRKQTYRRFKQGLK